MHGAIALNRDPLSRLDFLEEPLSAYGRYAPLLGLFRAHARKIRPHTSHALHTAPK